MSADPVVSPADTPEALDIANVENGLKGCDAVFPFDPCSAYLGLQKWVGALLAVGERDRRQIARLTEALEDECGMLDQSAETLRGMLKNWRTIVDAEDDDGGPLIENILYWLIEDLSSAPARAVLADEEDAQ